MKVRMDMKKSMFLKLSEDGLTAVLTRKMALKVIADKRLKKVELGSFRSGETIYFTLGLKFMWAWDSELIRRELKEFNIPLVRDDLEFYASTVDNFPLFVLKKHFDKVICVAPREFGEG